MKFLLYIFSFLFALSIHADVLYWQISSANEFDYAILCSAKTQAIAGKEWTVEDGYGDTKVIIRLPNNSYQTQKQYSLDGFKTDTVSIDLGNRNWGTYSFFVELYRYDAALNTDVRVNATQTITYNELSQIGCIYHNVNLPPTNLVVWQPTISAPEPNTIQLFLVGSLFLLLKRKTKHV